MTWLLLVPIVAVLVYLAVVGRRDRTPLAPLPPVTVHGFDEGRLTRPAEGLRSQPFDQDGDDGPDAA